MIKKTKHTNTKRYQNMHKRQQDKNEEQWFYKITRKQLTKWEE